MAGTPFIIIVVSGLLALAGTWMVLRRARLLGLVQVPNDRSSHHRPTPTGGGIGIVAGATFSALAIMPLPPLSMLVLVAASLLVAGIGFWDDRSGLPPRLRLAGQGLALVAGIVAAVPYAGLGAQIGAPAPLVVLAALVVALYWLNLFNFMDGIDGLAATEAIFLLCAAAGLMLAQPQATLAGLPLWCLAVGAATIGFLVFNWQPAAIFMGDVGSTFLGFLIAVIGLGTIAAGALSLWSWSILAAAFVVDATVTLLRRVLRRENLAEAHRRHAYQFLARRWGSHAAVTLVYAAINVLLLLPLAIVSQALPQWAPVATLAAFAPLAILAVAVGAGRPEHA